MVNAPPMAKIFPFTVLAETTLDFVRLVLLAQVLVAGSYTSTVEKASQPAVPYSLHKKTNK